MTGSFSDEYLRFRQEVAHMREVERRIDERAKESLRDFGAHAVNRKYPRTWLGDLNVSMHWPRAACFYMFILWGALLAPAVYWDRLALALLAAFGYLQVGSYAIDILRGNHIGQTNFSRRHLKARAAVGLLGIAIPVGLYLSWAVSWWLFPLAMVGLWGVVGYNYEVLGGHSRFVFALTWGAFPVLAHYVLMTLAIPPWPVWVFAGAAVVFSELHLTSYGNWSCRLPEKFCCISEGKTSCHGQAPGIRRDGVHREVHRLAKRQSHLQVVFLVLVTAGLAAARLLA